MAGTNRERTRLTVLLVVLAVVVVSAAVTYLSQGVLTTETESREELRHSPHSVSPLEMALLDGSREGTGDSQRNPFTFGAPPTPTPNLTPSPTPVLRATLPPRVRPPTPTPRPDGLPPPPPFERLYLGNFGPERLPVAVFRSGEKVEVAVPGDVIDGIFIVREVGYESVVIGFVGYPLKEITSVPLAEN